MDGDIFLVVILFKGGSAENAVIDFPKSPHKKIKNGQ